MIDCEVVLSSFCRRVLLRHSLTQRHHNTTPQNGRASADTNLLEIIPAHRCSSVSTVSMSWCVQITEALVALGVGQWTAGNPGNCMASARPRRRHILPPLLPYVGVGLPFHPYPSADNRTKRDLGANEDADKHDNQCHGIDHAPSLHWSLHHERDKGSGLDFTSVFTVLAQ